MGILICHRAIGGIGLAKHPPFQRQSGDVTRTRGVENFVRVQIERYVKAMSLPRTLLRAVIEVPAKCGLAALLNIYGHHGERQAAEALERANETLERRVHERTGELLGSIRTRAHGEADAANISKTKFWRPRATISCSRSARHDFMSPV